MKSQTKQTFADALYQLITVKPFDKIQVKDLCEACDASRPTFYYHFRDKYDLVAWIFQQDYEQVFPEVSANTDVVRMTQILHNMELKRSFYRQVFTDHSQNSIVNYIQELNVRMGVEKVKRYYGTDTITKGQLYLIKYHSYGSIQMMIEWLLNQHSMTAEEFAQMQVESMPELLKRIYA